MTGVFFGGSLVAATVAGMIALFAPWCISVMLPAYFASSFQNRRRLVAMTFIFAAGIGTVVLPIALGAPAQTPADARCTASSTTEGQGEDHGRDQASLLDDLAGMLQVVDQEAEHRTRHQPEDRLLEQVRKRSDPRERDHQVHHRHGGEAGHQSREGTPAHRGQIPSQISLAAQSSATAPTTRSCSTLRRWLSHETSGAVTWSVDITLPPSGDCWRRCPRVLPWDHLGPGRCDQDQVVAEGPAKGTADGLCSTRS